MTYAVVFFAVIAVLLLLGQTNGADGQFILLQTFFIDFRTSKSKTVLVKAVDE